MRTIKQLFNFYLNSSLHVAFAVYALSWITLIVFGVDYDGNVLHFNFFATITGYNFVKYFGVAKWHHRNLSGWLKAIQVLSFFSFIFMCYYLFKLQYNALLCIGFFALITFLYAIPLMPKKWYLNSHKNLRDVSGLKVYVIALVWSGVTVFFPLFNNNLAFLDGVFITLLQVFIFVIALMLPFEIRDLQFDSLKLATIPQKIGVKQTKLIGLLLLIILNTLELFKTEIVWRHYNIQLIISAILLVFIICAKQKQSKYYSAFFVEGIPILWLLMLNFF